MWIVIGVVIVLIIFGVYLASTAGRLDRLHHHAFAARCD